MMSNKFYLGLDLGKSADYSALAILEAQGKEAGRAYHCGFLKRWPLKTSYPDIVSDVAKIVGRDELQKPQKRDDNDAATSPVLAIDNTGVGAPVVDLFRAEFNQSGRRKVSFGVVDLDDSNPPRPPDRVKLQAIQITGGDVVSVDDEGVKRVPKRDLVSVTQVALQSGRLKIAETLPDARILTQELLNFQVKISLETAHDSYGAWREGSHDDLVLSVALALWVAESGPPVPPPISPDGATRESPWNLGASEYGRWPA